MKITEKIIANALFNWRVEHGHRLIVPNCCVLGHESDLLSVTKPGLIYEHEIKLTRADYRNEFVSRSKCIKHLDLRLIYERKSDHASHCPNFFFYVTPRGMLRRGDKFPHYAGLIEFDVLDRLNGASAMIMLSVRRKAPKLHDRRISDFQRDKIGVSLMHKLFSLRQ